jgi:hypothetical protein
MTRTSSLPILASLALLPLLPAQTPQTVAPAASATKPDAAHPETAEHILQDGIPVKLRLSRALTSEEAKAGQEIAFEVVDDIDVDGVTVLRRGTSARGVVTEAVGRKRLGQAGKLNFRIDYVPLVDNEKAPLRAVNNSHGDSRTDGMIGLMVSMPVAAAPFFLLIKGGEAAFSKGTELTAFIDGDMHLDLAKFGAAPQAAERSSVANASLLIDSTPAGAEIEIDGVAAGTTPATVAVAPGAHTVSVRKKGFADWSTMIDVTGGTSHVSAKLAEAQAP